MVPPCISTMRFEIARPRPVPPFCLVLLLSTCWNSSKMSSLVLGRNARTRVPYCDLEVSVDRIGKNVDRTRLGELDGIACKIEQDLRQTAFVPAADWKVLGNSRQRASSPFARASGSTAATVDRTTCPTE